MDLPFYHPHPLHVVQPSWLLESRYSIYFVEQIEDVVGMKFHVFDRQPDVGAELKLYIRLHS